MKRALAAAIAAVVIASALAGASLGAAETPAKAGRTVTVLTPAVKLDKTSHAVIVGAGFEPGQEVRLILFGAELAQRSGVESDIGYTLNPEPVANATGTWITDWNPGAEYIAKGLLAEGVYQITAVDADYTPLAPAVAIAFYDAKKTADKQPAWVKTYLASPK